MPVFVLMIHRALNSQVYLIASPCKTSFLEICKVQNGFIQVQNLHNVWEDRFFTPVRKD